MPTVEYEGQTIEVDEDGYLKDFDAWNETVACALAEQEGVSTSCPLTTEMMDVVKFMRDYYRIHQAFPVVRAVCKNVHQPKNCTYDQFPDPIVAWKIAGLPKPSSEVFARVKHEAWPGS
jgi:tRNA 2-thiouridine synthesizing protein E